jgi:thiamine-monophosphate kinase
MLSEFEFIKKITSLLKRKRAKLWIGDDAAALKVEGDKYLLLSSDSLVEGTHFLTSWVSLVPDFFFKIGKKLVNASVSDIASMGGTPLCALNTLVFPTEFKSDWAFSIYEGIAHASSELELEIVGGDTSSGSLLFLDFFVLGEAKAYMSRSGARAGDLVAVSGELGASRAGLELLLSKKFDEELVGKFLEPKARVREGKRLLELGVRCATDVSDGFLFNLGTVARASGVSIEVFSENIPLSQRAVKIFGKERAMEFALYGGEDYELIATFPEHLAGEAQELGFKIVGMVKEEEPKVLLDGEEVTTKGYEHFSGG